MRKSNYSLFMALALSLLAAGCDSDNNATAPQYEPEVVNNPNVAFSFQATGLEDISDVVSYTWSASSGSIVIHPSTATTAGTITLTIRDADNVVIYTGEVPASGDITPPSGAPGSWRISVRLTDYTGTINFALQMQ